MQLTTIGFGLFCILMACALPAFALDIVAHRGASHDAPENTLAAFRLAWERGADAIEGDFYLSQDGQIVCFHDKTTKRVCPNQPEVAIAKTSFEELRKLDVGSWKDARFAAERIPTLAEVLATVPKGKRILVEIKCGPEIVPELKRQLAESGLTPKQIVIIAFNEDVVKKCRQAIPQYKSNWLTGYDREKGQTAWQPTHQKVLRMLEATQATGLGTQANLDVITREFVEQVRAAGREFHVWTVNDPGEAQTLAKLGVDSLTTDRPAYIRQAITR